MANFFGKAKTKDAFLSPMGNDSVTIQTQTQFEKTFKNFVLKKDAELAPVNWFMETQKKREKIIVIDDERDKGNAIDVDVAMKGTSDVEADYSLMNERGLSFSLMS